jgi:hypothetical protein
MEHDAPTKIPRNAVFSLKLCLESLLRTVGVPWGPSGTKKCQCLKRSLTLRGSPFKSHYKNGKKETYEASRLFFIISKIVIQIVVDSLNSLLSRKKKHTNHNLRMLSLYLRTIVFWLLECLSLDVVCGCFRALVPVFFVGVVFADFPRTWQSAKDMQVKLVKLVS